MGIVGFAVAHGLVTVHPKRTFIIPVCHDYAPSRAQENMS
jgi:hypothetical protein